MDARRRRPSDETLAWVARSVGPRAEVVAWRRLTGGITASMHRLTVRLGADGRTETFVLRRWLFDDEAHLKWARACLERESTALAGLEMTEVAAPRLVAWTDGRDDGVIPALLMTRVPGRMNIAPRDPVAWVRQVAAALPGIHAATIDAPEWEPWIDPDTYEVPSWSGRPEVWSAAAAAMRDAAPSATCFIHRDYQHFNLLWQRERLTAVIDWANAATGPPDIDVGHCRLNLAVLFSAELADVFLRAYEAAAGRRVDSRFDLMSLLSYDQEWKRFIPVQVHGRAPIDLAGMDRRVEDTIAAAVARL